LDPQSNRELIGYLQQIHAAGHTLLISTHQYEELIELFDQVSVIDHGRDAFCGSSEEVFSQVDELTQVGLKAPLPALVAEQLRQKGWPLTEQIASFSSLENQLESLTRGGGR
jgi:ABC-type multidrug transport system ATPase subunit